MKSPRKKALSYITVGMLTVWSELQRAGERAAAEAKSLRKAVFERGAELSGSRKVGRLNIEADGVGIKLQRAAAKKGELKLIVGYEGKEGEPSTQGSECWVRRVLHGGRRCGIAGVTSGRTGRE